MSCSLIVLRDVFVIVIHEEVMLYVERRLMPCYEVSTCDIMCCGADCNSVVCSVVHPVASELEVSFGSKDLISNSSFIISALFFLDILGSQ